MAKKSVSAIRPQSYFDITNLPLLRKSFGSTYNPKSQATLWYKETSKKIDFLADLLSQNLAIKLIKVYRERPNTPQKIKKLKTHVLGGFIPNGCNKNDNLFIKLVFHKLDTSNPSFDIELDQDNKKKIAYKPYNSWLKKNKAKYSKQIAVNQQFPNNWNDLVSVISPHVKLLIDERLKMNTIKLGANSGDSDAKQKGGGNGNTFEMPLNLILYGPPGTGKTFHSITYAVSILTEIPLQVLLDKCSSETGRKEVKSQFDEFVKSGNIIFTTFHQSLSYEDFIEGIKPMEPVKGKSIQYEVRDGIFKEICDRATECLARQKQDSSMNLSFADAFEQFQAEWSNNNQMLFPLTQEGKDFTITSIESKNLPFRKASGGTAHSLSKKTLKELFYGTRVSYPSGLAIYYKSLLEKLRSYSPQDDTDNQKPDNCKHVLIIDEINRGNVAQIFGELITLIEEDKRRGGKEEINVTLPYSKETFSVPQNLYIVGTLNTADRSVEALDSALRRRFSFIPIMPAEEKLTRLTCQDSGRVIDLNELLGSINKRLKILRDGDHTIGHAWLWNVNDFDKLRNAFNEKIIPLLQEYFYNDFEKLGLVLGNSFIEEDFSATINDFAPFNNVENLRNLYNNKKVYRIKDFEKWTIEDFVSIYHNH
ncbi:MAG TPA: AAA family ATPase [Bacteroidales bacterium]|jgi:5-methylcytosine-specific restriction protein B|nr:AAA family ATPase [Bacteroidales bacterium]